MGALRRSIRVARLYVYLHGRGPAALFAEKLRFSEHSCVSYGGSAAAHSRRQSRSEKDESPGEAELRRK